MPRATLWLLASCTTAVVAHWLIGFFGSAGIGGDDYAARGHAAVGPVLGAVLVLASSALFAAALRGAERSRSEDPALALAREFRKMHPFACGVAVAAGGLAVLLSMEFCEQLAAAGRIEGIGDALGGNAATGLTLIGIVATLIATAGVRFARTLLIVTVETAEAFVAWACFAVATSIEPAARISRDLGRCRTFAAALLAHSNGLRAPPPAPV
jgi:hypothetical protein